MSHTMWPIWETLKTYMRHRLKLLELGPGSRPKIPVKNSYFVELSEYAGHMLSRNGGIVIPPDHEIFLRKKPVFDIACAFEVLEHLPDDRSTLQELNHVTKRNGRLFLSVPVHMHHWSEWDAIVGHQRRYEPAQLQKLLNAAGFEIEKYAVDAVFSKAYSNALVRKLAKYSLSTFPELSMRVESHSLRIVCALAKKFKPLEWKRGCLDELDPTAAGVYVVCKKAS